MKKNHYASILLLLGLFFILLLMLNDRASASRDININYLNKLGDQESFLYNESHALVIGISQYKDFANPIFNWPDLPGVKKDIQLVKNELERHRFHVVILENPSRSEIDDAINRFINKYGMHPDNRLLIYFSGHGYTMKLAFGREMGFIVPADAPNPKRDELGFLAKALDMVQMEVYAKRIQSKHALFLFDSCFSGSIFSLSKSVPENIGYKTRLPVRMFITAGSAEEMVPDESIFRRQFIDALRGDADMDRDGYISGTELGEFLQRTVINYTYGAQHPQYGKLRDPNLDKGDFIFTLSKLESQKGGKDDVAFVKNEKQRLKTEKKELKEKQRSLQNEIKLLETKQRLEEEFSKLENKKMLIRKLEEKRRRLKAKKEQTKVASLPPDMLKKAGRSVDGRYIDNGKGIIKDTHTGLMWAKKDSYADLEKCMNWNDSKLYIKNLKIGGYRDWQMPTIKQLKTIYEKSKLNNLTHDQKIPLHLDEIFSNGASYGFWTSKTNGTCCASNIEFYNGFLRKSRRLFCNNKGVRAVRRAN